MKVVECKDATLYGIEMDQCIVEDTLFEESCFEGAVLENCRFEEVELYDAKIPQEVLSSMNLDEEQLEDRVEV